MKKLRRRIMAALALTALLPMVATQAQEWTVFELPGNVSEVPQLIEDQFGCTWEELTTKHNITHLKITGTDFGSNNWDSNGKNALRQLALKAQVIDLSEVKANPDWGFYTTYYDGPDPHNVIEFINPYDFDSLRCFIFPKELHHLSTYSGLSYCDQLTEVVWPDSLVQLSSSLFKGCKALCQIDIPATVYEIPSQCFRSCSNLQTVTLHEGALKKISESAFYDCNALTTFNVPNGVETIGNDCFIYCGNLKNVMLPQTITDFGSGTFYKCEKLEAITLPSRIKAISNSMFYGCSSLSGIVIPDSVEIIGNEAFYNCTDLRSLILPAGLTTIGNHAFRNTALEQFDMPDGVTSLGEYAFGGCAQLRRVHLSRQLTAIPARCFSDCNVLSEVNIPRRITSIGHDAFVCCYELPAPDLPEGLKSIDEAAFWKCRFPQITLPSTLQFIGNQCFRYSHLRSIDVPASVVQIGSKAFMECDSLHTATLHEGLLYLLSEAFRDNKLLQDVALPNSLRILGDAIFQGNKSKKTFTQPPLISVVPKNICSNCNNLTSVVLHDHVTKIDNTAFNDCTQLAHIDLPEGLTDIGSWAFVNCPLTEISIPSTVRYIRNRAFNGGQYSRVVVPEGVERIEERAFYSKQLRHVDFPSTVSFIGQWGFQGDGEGCDSIILRNPLPPRSTGSLYRNRFGGALYVPAGSVEAYKQNSGFSGFTNILPLNDFTPTNMVVAVTCSTDSTWFPVVNNTNLTLAYDNEGDSKQAGHLHVGSNVTWPLNHLRIDYCQPWMSYDWRTKYFTGTFINEGTMTAHSMEMNLQLDGPDHWFYFTPPADMTVASFVCRNPRIPFVVRSFNGAQRAAGNHNHVWQNVSSTDTLHAGQGYILRYTAESRQTAYESYSYVEDNAIFHMENAYPLRSFMLESDDVTLPLTEYKGEFPHNEGWNMVANPFMAYFDIKHLESDAPILASDYNPTFKAYSPLDDDLVLFPLQAFLVQRSNEQTSVTFHPEGRQADYNLHREASTSNARELRRAALRRQRVVYDATLLRHNQQGDTLLASTRIVVTPTATEGYDRGHDAPFITMDDSLTALYTRSGGLRYSLNEQPPTTANVQIGMHIDQAGTYTLCINVRGEALPAVQHLWLKDTLTGTETDLLADDYTFTIDEPCTLNNRFVLQIADGITNITDVEQSTQNIERSIYDLQGRPVNRPSKGIYIKGGKKITHY